MDHRTISRYGPPPRHERRGVPASRGRPPARDRIPATPVPRWLPDDGSRPEAELVSLNHEAEALLGRAVASAQAWAAVPTVGAVDGGEHLLDDLEARADDAATLLPQGRAVLASLGTVPDDEETGVVEAASVIERLEAARNTLAAVASVSEAMSGRRISVRDGAVLADVASSLSSADVSAAWLAPGFPGLYEAVAPLHEDTEKAAAVIAAEFGFDPRTRSEAAFGGVLRAFSSSRASDFLLAVKKLGIEIRNPAQAQRAAEIFKTYLTAVEALREVFRSQPGRKGVPEASHLQGKSARLKLAVALRRRMSVIGVESDFVASIPDYFLAGDETLQTLVLSSDAEAMVRANASATEEGSLEDMAASIGGQVAFLERWRTTVSEASAACGSSRWADIERQVAGLRDEAESLRRHISWIREACMLPLSDDELRCFIDHAALVKAEERPA